MKQEKFSTVILSIGSNYRAENNIKYALSCLNSVLNNIKCSRLIRTKPIGIVSDMFMNQLVCGTCDISRNKLHDIIKKIEYDCGRNDEEKKSGRVRMDIDVLEFNGEREHEQDWEREYVQLLIKEL